MSPRMLLPVPALQRWRPDRDQRGLPELHLPQRGPRLLPQGLPLHQTRGEAVPDHQERGRVLSDHHVPTG